MPTLPVPPISEIDAVTLAQRCQQGDVHILDVREPWEHAQGSLPGAQLVPLAQLPQRLDALGPNRAATWVTFCHHGVRSQKAAACLLQAGFTDVFSLRGGIDAWSRDVDPSVGRY